MGGTHTAVGGTCLPITSTRRLPITSTRHVPSVCKCIVSTTRKEHRWPVLALSFSLRQPTYMYLGYISVVPDTMTPSALLAPCRFPCLVHPPAFQVPLPCLGLPQATLPELQKRGFPHANCGLISGSWPPRGSIYSSGTQPRLHCEGQGCGRSRYVGRQISDKIL